MFVEVAYFRYRFHAETTGFVGQDVIFSLVEIKFILDIADDLFQHVLNRHQARNTTIFIHNDGNVITIGLEFAQ